MICVVSICVLNSKTSICNLKIPNIDVSKMSFLKKRNWALIYGKFIDFSVCTLRGYYKRGFNTIPFSSLGSTSSRLPT